MVDRQWSKKIRCLDRGGGATTREELFVPEKLRADCAFPERASKEGAWAAQLPQNFWRRPRPAREPYNLTTPCCDPIAAVMVRGELPRTIWAAAEGLLGAPRPQCTRTIRYAQRSMRPATRFIATTHPRRAELASEPPESKPVPFSAAPEIDFDNEDAHRRPGKKDKEKADKANKDLLGKLRVVPASPSYFSAKPTFTDDFINLSALLRSVATLPTIPAIEAPRVAWKTIDQYRIMTNEPVKNARYHRMLHILKRLNCVHPTLMPEQVRTAMRRYMKDSQPGDVVPAPEIIDKWGRAKGVGRRKTSSAVAWLVEGEGEVLVNGKSLSSYFGRLHHRESAVWALKATQRLDKYNIFGLVQGGGSTGQAEALTLAVAKALLVHEPALKPALRRGRQTAIPIRALLMLCSWYHHSRPEKGGTEEDWSRQGSQDAHLGQALIFLRAVYYPCVLAYVPVVPYWNRERLTHWLLATFNFRMSIPSTNLQRLLCDYASLLVNMIWHLATAPPAWGSLCSLEVRAISCGDLM